MRAVRVGAEQPRHYRTRRPCTRCGIEWATRTGRGDMCRDCTTTTEET